MGVFNFTVIPILDDDPHSPSSSSSKSCHSMMEKGLKSSHLLVKEMNKKKERTSKSKATSSSAASMKFCLCAPPTHPGSFKCRLHRATTSSHTRSVSSSAHYINGVKYIKNLNPFKLVVPSQSGGIRISNKGNVQGKPKLSRFGRAALASAAASSVQIQPISAAFRQMSLD